MRGERKKLKKKIKVKKMQFDFSDPLAIFIPRYNNNKNHCDGMEAFSVNKVRLRQSLDYGRCENQIRASSDYTPLATM